MNKLGIIGLELMNPTRMYQPRRDIVYKELKAALLTTHVEDGRALMIEILSSKHPNVEQWSDLLRYDEDVKAHFRGPPTGDRCLFWACFSIDWCPSTPKWKFSIRGWRQIELYLGKLQIELD